MKSFEPTSLSLNQKIGQLFFIGLPGAELDKETIDLLDLISPGGICLFARNIKGLEQTHELLKGVRARLPIEPFLSLDQEGGLVDRLRRVMTPLPAANQIKNIEHAGTLGKIIGETISRLGFNMDFAPVVDIVDDSRSEVGNGLLSRTFGHSKEETTELAGAFLQGLQEFGIIGCLKHFPGLGAAKVDSHNELPLIGISDKELDSVDIFPYQKLLSRKEPVSVMIAHAAYPNTGLQESLVDGKLLPSSLSPAFVSILLRERLRFSGVAITDDLEMGAITNEYGIGKACKLSIHAGIDMLAICSHPEMIIEGFNAVYDAVVTGEISEKRIDESLRRIAELKAHIAPGHTFDLKQFEELGRKTDILNKSLV